MNEPEIFLSQAQRIRQTICLAAAFLGALLFMLTSNQIWGALFFASLVGWLIDRERIKLNAKSTRRMTFTADLDGKPYTLTIAMKFARGEDTPANVEHISAATESVIARRFASDDAKQRYAEIDALLKDALNFEKKELGLSELELCASKLQSNVASQKSLKGHIPLKLSKRP